MAVGSENMKLSQLTVEDLKAHLQQRKLPHVGPKTILIKRLKKALLDAGEDPDSYVFKAGGTDAEKKPVAAASTKGKVAVVKKGKPTPTKSTEKTGEETKASDTPGKKVAPKKAVESKVEEQPAKKAASDTAPLVSKDKKESSGKGSEDNKGPEAKSEDVNDDDYDAVVVCQISPKAEAKKSSTPVKVGEKTGNKEPEVEQVKPDGTGDTLKTGQEESEDLYTKEEEHDYELEETDDDARSRRLRADSLQDFGDMDDDNDDGGIIDLDYNDDDLRAMSKTDLDGSTEGSDLPEKKKSAKVTETELKAKKDMVERKEKVKTSKKVAENASVKGEESNSKEDKAELSEAAKNEPVTLWVVGLPTTTKAADLKVLFSKHGKVLSAKIVTNAKVPGARCYGLITVPTEKQASLCIKKIDGTEFGGKVIHVKYTKKDSAKPKDSTLKSTEASKKKNEADGGGSSDGSTKVDEEKESEAERMIRLQKERRRKFLKERDLKDLQRRHLLEKERQRQIEQKQREEALQLEREREKLRIERERIAKERAELIKLERDRIEKEKEELKRQQLRLEEARRIKRAQEEREESENARKRAAVDPRRYEERRDGAYDRDDSPPSQQNFRGSDKDSGLDRREEKYRKRSEEREGSERGRGDLSQSERDVLYLHHRRMKEIGLASLQKIKRSLKKELSERERSSRSPIDRREPDKYSKSKDRYKQDSPARGYNPPQREEYVPPRRIKEIDIESLQKMKRNLKRELRLSEEEEGRYKREHDVKKDRYGESSRSPPRRDLSPPRMKQRYIDGDKNYKRDDGPYKRDEYKRDDRRDDIRFKDEKMDYGYKPDYKAVKPNPNAYPTWDKNNAEYARAAGQANPWNMENRKQENPPWSHPAPAQQERWPSSGFRGRGGMRGSSRGRFAAPTAQQGARFQPPAPSWNVTLTHPYWRKDQQPSSSYQ